MSFKPPAVADFNLATYEHDEHFELPVGVLSDKLEDVTHLALDKAKELLSSIIEKDHPLAGHLLRSQTALVNTILATAARVDETNLKRAVTAADTIGRIVAMVKEAQEANPKLR